MRANRVCSQRPRPALSRQWDTRDPHGILANIVAVNDPQRRPRSGKERFAAAEYEGTEVEAVLVDETEVSEARREFGSGDVDLSVDIRLQSAHERFDVLRYERGIRADRLQRGGHDPLRLRAPGGGEVVLDGVPVRLILVPVAHDLVDPSTIQGAGE